MSIDPIAFIDVFLGMGSTRAIAIPSLSIFPAIYSTKVTDLTPTSTTA